MFIVLLLSLFALSEQCCMPAQWEGTATTIVGSSTPTPSLNRIFGKLSYDGNTKMINYAGTSIYNGATYAFRSIQDYKTNVMYTITGGQCTKDPAPLTYLDRCLNGTSTTATIGTGSGAKNIHLYQVQQNGYTFDISVDDDCILVDEIIFSDNQLMADRLTNTTVGIKDMSVFDIPDICKHTDMLVG